MQTAIQTEKLVLRTITKTREAKNLVVATAPIGTINGSVPLAANMSLTRTEKPSVNIEHASTLSLGDRLEHAVNVIMGRVSIVRQP